MVTEQQQQEFKAAYKAQTEKDVDYDAAHYTWQPVEGRHNKPKQPMPDRKDRKGFTGAKLLESNADLVIFGHEQDGKQAGSSIPEGAPKGYRPRHFELQENECFGSKKRVGKMDSNNSEIDSVVFGVDLDDYNGIKDLEAEMAKLPQFSMAAGRFSSEIDSSNVMQVKPPSTSLYTQLKNASDVDEVVFGHEMGGGHSEDLLERVEQSPMYENSSGVHSTEKAIRETQMWYGGPKGKKSTAIQQGYSSKDQSFQKPEVSDLPHFTYADEFQGAAGREEPHNEDGSQLWLGKGCKHTPEDHLDEDFAARDPRQDRLLAHPPAPLPILSQEHNGGSIKSVVFSGAEPEGNREVLGVPNLGPNASVLEKREQSRRLASASGVRSQAYVNGSEFADAAGLKSDELYFANTADLVRRIKPVTRKAAYSDMTEVDTVVFGHDLEGGDRDGASIMKEQAFKDSAGATSAKIHETLANSRSAPMDVPQPRDQMDNIVFGREMQNSEYDIRMEIAAQRAQIGAAGQASSSIDQKAFDRRLENHSAVGAAPMPLKDNEPKGDMRGSVVTVGERGYPAAYEGCIGAPRDVLDQQVANDHFVQGSKGGQPRLRARHDFDGGDVKAALDETEPGKFAPLTGHPSTMSGAAGKPMRAINDQDPVLMIDKRDSAGPPEPEADMISHAAHRNRSSHKVTDVLDGHGYVERQAHVQDPYVKGGGALPVTYNDSVRELNLLKPDVNLDKTDALQGEVWSDYKTAFEVYMAEKNFGQGVPYGVDASEQWYGSQGNALTEKELADLRTEYAIEHAYRKEAAETGFKGDDTEAGHRRKQFVLSKLKAEDEAEKAQNKLALNIGFAALAPFGVSDMKPSYSTSTKEGAGNWASPGLYEESMASKMSKRRLERASQRSPAGSSRPTGMVSFSTPASSGRPGAMVPYG